MQRRGKQSKIYRAETLQILKCRDEETQVKYRELKYRRWQYAQTSKAK